VGVAGAETRPPRVLPTSFRRPLRPWTCRVGASADCRTTAGESKRSGRTTPAVGACCSSIGSPIAGRSRRRRPARACGSRSGTRSNRSVVRQVLVEFKDSKEPPHGPRATRDREGPAVASQVLGGGQHQTHPTHVDERQPVQIQQHALVPLALAHRGALRQQRPWRGRAHREAGRASARPRETQPLPGVTVRRPARARLAGDCAIERGGDPDKWRSRAEAASESASQTNLRPCLRMKPERLRSR
jgi:hypothetical protein